MDLSYSTYMAFWGNPNRARMQKGLGLRKTQKPDSMARGSVAHLLAKAFHYAWTPEMCQSEFDSENITQEQIQDGLRFWPVLKAYIESRPGDVIQVEQEVFVPIEDTPHRIHGVLENVLKWGPIHWVDEYKTSAAWGGKDYVVKDLRKRWKADQQVNFEILMARQLGFPVNRIDIVTVWDGKNPETGKKEVQLLPVIPEERSEHHLNWTKRSVAMTCDIIEMWIEKYGVDDPWPEVIQSKWSTDLHGGCNNGWCEFEGMCDTSWDGTIPEGWEQRPECWRNLYNKDGN